MVSITSTKYGHPRSRKNKTCYVTSILLGIIVLLSFNIKEKNYAPSKVDSHITSSTQRMSRPFAMPEVGENYKLFQPIYDMDQSKLEKPLFSPAKDFLDNFSARLTWVKSITGKDRSDKSKLSTNERAQEYYIELMKGFLTGTLFNDVEVSVGRGYSVLNLDKKKRENGEDWAYIGDTMTGTKRMDNIWELLKRVTKDNIPGDYIETGVWRGGASVFARSVLNALGEVDRITYVCDSFAGLPPGDRDLDKNDKGWDRFSGYLSVSEDVVANNFQKSGLMDSNVVFVKGFFNDTMPPLSKHIKSFAVMRLDGDMYESTVDVLYNMYDKLSVGGYVIMDDWNGFPSKTAVNDFFAVHGINPEIIAIDATSIYWKKTEEVDIQYWRYEKNKFKPGDEKKEKVQV